MAPRRPPADFKFARKGRGVDVFITGHQNLIFRLRRTDAYIKEQSYLTNERIGKKLVATARVLWMPHNRSGTVYRNIAYEQKELANTYQLFFGLKNARATRGSKSVGSRAFADGAEGTEGEAAHGIWVDKGTGIYGLWKRPYPSRRTGTRRGGRPWKMLLGIPARPWLTPAYTVNRPWIDEQHRELGRKLKVYLDSGVEPS